MKPAVSANASLVSLVSLVLTAGAARSLAQTSVLDQPLPPLALPHVQYIDVGVEAEQSTITSGGSQTTYQRYYVAPTVGIGWDYFLYHPDLMTFSLLAEPGYMWQSSGTDQHMSEEKDLMLNGNFNATLLQLKPYSSTVFANASHATCQYDFFNTVVQDVKGIGCTTGYREGAVPFTVTFQKTLTDSSGLTYNNSMDQTALNLHASNQRANEDGTDLTYQYEDMTWNQSTQGGGNMSDTHDLSLTDLEHFGKSTLNSTLLYNHSEYSGLAADNVNLGVNLTVEHTPRLQSFYNYTIGDYSTDDGNSVQNNARVGLQHQLYESLFSSLDVHGNSVNSDYTGSTLASYSGGGAVSFNYSKHLGAWGHLTAGNSASYDLTEQQSTGSVLLIADEAHQLNTGQWVRLNQPRAIDDGNFRVTTSSHMLLTEGTDYYVDRTKDIWQIQISPFSLLIASGDTVLVTYDIQPNPTGNYSTFTDSSQARLELWNGLMDFYLRYNHTENSASSANFVLENLDQFQAGTDFNWKRLHLGASYNDSRSSLFSYHSYLTTENYSLLAFRHSDLSIYLDQQWSFYPASTATGSKANDITFYNYRLHYGLSPLPGVTWSAEAGLQQQRGGVQAEDLFTFRTYLEWTAGRLKVNLGYEYDNQKYTATTTTGQQRHFAFLRFRRNF